MTGLGEMPADPFGEGGLGLDAAARLWRELIRAGTADVEAGLARAVGALTEGELRAVVLRKLLATAYGLSLLDAPERPDPPPDSDPALLDLAAERLWPLVAAVQRMTQAELLALVHRPLAAALIRIRGERP